MHDHNTTTTKHHTSPDTLYTYAHGGNHLNTCLSVQHKEKRCERSKHKNMNITKSPLQCSKRTKGFFVCVTVLACCWGTDISRRSPRMRHAHKRRRKTRIQNMCMCTVKPVLGGISRHRRVITPQGRLPSYRGSSKDRFYCKHSPHHKHNSVVWTTDFLRQSHGHT